MAVASQVSGTGGAIPALTGVPPSSQSAEALGDLPPSTALATHQASGDSGPASQPQQGAARRSPVQDRVHRHIHVSAPLPMAMACRTPRCPAAEAARAGPAGGWDGERQHREVAPGSAQW